MSMPFGTTPPDEAQYARLKRLAREGTVVSDAGVTQEQLNELNALADAANKL